ncbi:flavin-dependent monooxygenase [Nocardia sp. NBC_01503]|uniref:3-hydroxy-9,10-secoandrosta-1,3,5(10)-triene-9, 17-dione monooxygenase oxygenase subunit n=1 Tax=Nocardia sp. NBC_01503 TaxID=2975997 RepID=UPI002E7BAE68|nr:3-hydroxy-9,10-secoandrosta-1,3,5(10)-triene-9,17-dione monooxygenase oxygenase subunit [Nocardia sp. NBC_01503]WTL33811.1 flavin-dependent monooxygenase [Nocardia sp. NBC_01503]
MTHEVVEKIQALLPELRERAQETEDQGQVSEASIKALQDTGFFKLMQPIQWGGYAAEPVVLYDCVRLLASACSSTGWVASIVGVHNWHLALFDQQAQQDVWGADTEVRISSSYAPMGSGTKVEGGYIVKGSWAFSSGSAHADWAFVGGLVMIDGNPADFGTFLIPRAEYTIDETWNVIGLSGTGSNTIVVEDVFVPEHRFLSFLVMNEFAAPGAKVNTEPLYRMPWGTIMPTTISAPVVGMAQGAYAAFVEHQGKRVRAAFLGENAKDDPFIKVRVAEAASDIDAAWRQLVGNLQAEWELVLAGQDIPMDLRMAARRDQVRATQRSVGAIDQLFAASGATALVKGTPLQRFWRDAHAARVHATNDAERAYVMFGDHTFGLPGVPGMV